MLVKDSDALKRINSPLNLINKLRNETSPRNRAMSLFIKPSIPPSPVTVFEAPVTVFEAPATFNPFEKKQESVAITPETVNDKNNEEPTLDTLLENGDSQIKLAKAHDSALGLLTRSLDKLTAELDNVRPDKLPGVVSAAAKTVEGIRRERNEVNKNSKGKDVHYHFYTPIQKKVSDYEVVEVA